MRSLSVGDYIWIARKIDGTEMILEWIVERKTWSDLQQSIRKVSFLLTNGLFILCEQRDISLCKACGSIELGLGVLIKDVYLIKNVAYGV